MPTHYDLIGTQSSIQVLSATLVQPIVVATIATKPSAVVASYWIDKITYDAGEGPALLTTFAENVESIISTGKAIGGSGNQTVEPNGLLKQWVTFVVAYTPTGSTTGPLTVDVDVPVSDLGGITEFGANYGLQDAEKLIDDAYAQLVKLAGG